MNDLMTANILPNTVYSNFNLFVLEESSWYIIDKKIKIPISQQIKKVLDRTYGRCT